VRELAGVTSRGERAGQAHRHTIQETREQATQPIITGPTVLTCYPLSVPPLATRSTSPAVGQSTCEPARTATAALTYAHARQHPKPTLCWTNTQTLRIPSPISRKLHLFAEIQITNHNGEKAPPRQRTSVWGNAAAPRYGRSDTHGMGSLICANTRPLDFLLDGYVTM
jgi:hypothetical protein